MSQRRDSKILIFSIDPETYFSISPTSRLQRRHSRNKRRPDPAAILCNPNPNPLLPIDPNVLDIPQSAADRVFKARAEFDQGAIDSDVYDSWSSTRGCSDVIHFVGRKCQAVPSPEGA